MTSSISLRVKWTEQTRNRFGPKGFDIPWDESKLQEIRVATPPLLMEAVARWIETTIEDMYMTMTDGDDQCQSQVGSIERKGSRDVLQWDFDVSEHLRDGDTIIVDCMLVTASMVAASKRPQFTEGDLDKFRSLLRFGLNDRVLCFCGPRWFSGLIVGTAVPEEDDLLPYLVKTDPLPGFPQRTISVPMDRDQICTQEVCFDPISELHLVKAAATPVKDAAKPKLRFSVGEAVFVRIRNNAEDGLEEWVKGKVAESWPKLGGELKFEIGDLVGEFPDQVPYKVDLGGGKWVYCHKDNFTLIRRDGMQPRTRVRGISKRMEVVRDADGSSEQIDHMTERRKRLRVEVEDDDSD